MIFRWYHFVSGFTQNRGRACGLDQIVLDVLAASVPDSFVQYHTWDSKWDDVAAFTARCSDPAPAVYLAGFSWGGSAVVELARELDKLGLKVAHMVLCDPVYHPKTVGFEWLALTPLPTIEIPANVREVTWFRQYQNIPRGHDLAAAPGADTIIHPPVVLDRVHSEMDDAPEFRDACLKAIGVSGA